MVHFPAFRSSSRSWRPCNLQPPPLFHTETAKDTTGSVTDTLCIEETGTSRRGTIVRTTSSASSTDYNVVIFTFVSVLAQCIGTIRTHGSMGKRESKTVTIRIIICLIECVRNRITERDDVLSWSLRMKRIRKL